MDTDSAPTMRRRPGGAAAVFMTAVILWAAAVTAATVVSPSPPNPGVAAAALTAAALTCGVLWANPAPRLVVGAAGGAGAAAVTWGGIVWIDHGDVAELAAAPFHAANSLGAVAALTAVLALAGADHAARARRPRVTVAAVLAAAVCAQVMLRSGSMGSLLAAAVGLVALAGGVAGRDRRVGLVRLLSFTATAAGLALALGLAATALMGGNTESPASSGVGVDPDNHATEHLAQWSAAVRVWVDHPLSGVGPRRFTEATRELGAAGGVPSEGYEDARSDLFTLLAEVGIVGSLAWVAAVGTALWAALAGLARRRAAASTAVLAARSGVVLLAVYGLVDVTNAVPLLLAETLVLGAVCVGAIRPEPAPILPAAPAGCALR